MSPGTGSIHVSTERTSTAVVTTIDTSLDAEAVGALRAGLSGQLVLPSDETYDTAREQFSFRDDPHPTAIIRAKSENDVALAVTFARSQGLPIAVRSGGHALSAVKIIDGAALICVSQMTQVTVDPQSRTARIQPGATSHMIAAAAHEHGLAISTGDTGSVGMGGLATGGGIGFMVRAYGLTVDNILSARVVTADGSVLVASPVEHPDLFWAIRGGGSNFGVVTEFTVRLAMVDQILGGVLVLPATADVISGFLSHGPDAPDDLTLIGNVMHCPPMPFVAPEDIGKPVLAIIVCWTGDPEDGQAALAPFRALAEPLVDLINPMPYPGLYQFTDVQSGRHAAHIRNMFADQIGPASIDAIISGLDRAPLPFSIIQLRPVGGAMARVDPDATAFAHRDQRYFVSILGAWFDPEDDGSRSGAWVEEIWGAIKGEGRGAYVNFLQDEGAERTRDAYGKTTYERLSRVKQMYDPENVFRHNQNIPPAG